MAKTSAFPSLLLFVIFSLLILAPPALAQPNQPAGAVKNKLCIIDQNPSSVKNGTNYLVRGTMPLYFDLHGGSSTFADDDIQEALRKKTKNPAFDLTKYNLIVVPLIVNSSGVEGTSLQYEATSLTGVSYPPAQKRLTPGTGPTPLAGNSAQYAQIIWWPMAGGCPMQPPAPPYGNCSANCPQVQDYDIVDLIALLHGYLTNPLTSAELKNGLVGRVIYFHCETGTDRTGMLDLSYRMTIFNNNFDTAVDNAISSCQPCVMQRTGGLCGPPSGCISAVARPMWPYLCLAQAYCHSFHDLRDCGFSEKCGDVDKTWCRDNSGSCY
jgi:hypothetical protein